METCQDAIEGEPIESPKTLTEFIEEALATAPDALPPTVSARLAKIIYD